MNKYNFRTMLAFLVLSLTFVFSVSSVQAEEEVKDPNPPVAASSVSINAVGGPDMFGYTYIDSAEPFGPFPFFIDISGSGTMAPYAGGDTDGGGTSDINIGFAFNFYGTIYNQVRAAADGFLSFGSTSTSFGDLSNDCPLPATPSTGDGARLYPLHDDLIGSTLYYQNFIVCPTSAGGDGACTVFQWEDAEHWPASEEFDFQAILYENGNILTQYGPGNPETGAGSTTGIQNANATIGLTYACDTGGSIPDANHAVLFEITKPFGIDINFGSCVFTKSTLNFVHIEGLTPLKKVALVYGQELGQFIVGGNVCNGLALDVKNKVKILGLFKANASGVANVQLPLEHIEAHTDGYIQVVDIATCTKSDPIITKIFDNNIEIENVADFDEDGVENCFDECPFEGPPGPGEVLLDNGCVVTIPG